MCVSVYVCDLLSGAFLLNENHINEENRASVKIICSFSEGKAL